jgi:ADP-heptose:LPS heptosyltransferase
VDLGGRTSLRQLCALMPLLDAFIGPDSGPTHLAAASGVPTVFLFSGQNEYGRWKPRAERARTLRREVPCAPCGLRRCTVAGHPCMAGIDPAEALEALASVMRERA